MLQCELCVQPTLASLSCLLCGAAKPHKGPLCMQSNTQLQAQGNAGK